MKQKQLALLTSSKWQDYELLDSGNSRKLERFGFYNFIRPESQAIWEPRLNEKDWHADGIFIPNQDSSRDGDGGGWQLSKELPESWTLSYESLRFMGRPTPFRHLGFFPEQAVHWEWCASAIRTFIIKYNRPPSILNLFAYSGIASLHAASAGANVTHLDASKKAINQAFENRDICKMREAPIRFITDDATRFVDRELRREKSYDGIILDPPKYGRGPKGEVWRIETHLAPLLKKCHQLLSKDALFMVLTIYAIRASSIAAHNALAELFSDMGGVLESGELALRESAIEFHPKKPRRVLPQANFARWHSNISEK